MSEQPQKRLVTRRRYIVLLGKRFTLYSLAALGLSVGVGGLLFLFRAFLIGLEAIPLPANTDLFEGYTPLLMMLSIVLPGVLFWFSKKLFVKAKSIEPVSPITDHNAHLLPQQETLVRGSEEPPVAQSDILLRAATSGQETPPEQLLRPTTEE